MAGLGGGDGLSGSCSASRPTHKHTDKISEFQPNSRLPPRPIPDELYELEGFPNRSFGQNIRGIIFAEMVDGII